jgi:DNA polymerase III delta prime subunit
MSIVHTKAWDEKYRPKTVQECILAQDIKDTFQGFVDSNFIPNLLLTGTSGVGKTTVARALCAELDYDIYEVNGSLNLGIDKLRTDIQQHAATMSFTNNRKAVFIDEADYLNAQSVQPALRGFIQDYHENCAFIMTANFPKKIIGPLAESRMTIVDFKIPSAERGKIAQAQFKRLCEILDLEGIE